MLKLINDKRKTDNGFSLKINTREELEEIIKHERYRTDRTGVSFSFVLFHIENDNADNKVDFIKYLVSRIRNIDEIGIFDNNRTGIVLPDTDLKGAHAFALNADKNIVSRKISYNVYSYPDAWFESESYISSVNTIGTVPEPGHSASLKEFNTHVESFIVSKIPGWKRVIDFAGSAFGLILCLPLFLLVAVYIKIVSPGPVFFRQERVGYKGKRFTFLKFRTMKHDNNEDFHKSHATDFIKSDKKMDKLDNNDSRIIPGGKFLRKACIDELPQLINVLRGDMSLVGPRPCIPYEALEYLQWHKNRFNILPGMTGLWQVSGKNDLTFKQMVRLDISYIKSLSLWNDIKIMFRTVPAVISLVFESVKKKLRNK
jgi:lipopolysaccharide/colanic/teichoic acid biosynthesis glycosyltransferase